MKKTFDHQSGGSLKVEGASIYFESVGTADGPPLLLLHGGFGTVEDFNVILPRLNEKFRIIGIDSRGQGKSTLGTAELTYQRMQEDVERVIEHLDLRDLTIIGLSDGGIVGYRLAARLSLRIDKLVTIGARWQLKEADPVRKIFTKVTGEGWRKKFPETYATYEKVNPEPNFDRLAEALVKMWLDPSGSGYPNELVDTITCETLIVRGDDDRLFSRESVVEIARRVKGSKLSNIAFAGHVAFQDQTEVFMQGLNRFLRV